MDGWMEEEAGKGSDGLRGGWIEGGSTGGMEAGKGRRRKGEMENGREGLTRHNPGGDYSLQLQPIDIWLMLPHFRDVFLPPTYSHSA